MVEGKFGGMEGQLRKELGWRLEVGVRGGEVGRQTGLTLMLHIAVAGMSCPIPV